MKLRSRWGLLMVLLALALVIGSAASVLADPSGNSGAAQGDRYVQKIQKARERLDRKITQEEREAAADRQSEARAKLDAAVAAGEISAAAAAPPVVGPGDVPDYYESPNWAYSPPLRKFVDTLPGLGAANANNLEQYIPVGHPDTVTYPGSDYYEIELREYTEKMHSDLPPTTLRGYVQVNSGTDLGGNNTIAPDPIHYLGPTIVANKGRPVRIKFTNKLPIGAGGDLFIPVDTSVMGAGEGPIEGEFYTENRATLHLHGGRTPWISDGTPHQWITPANENTPYTEGVSVENVPDMPDPGDGSMTFFYSNQQSARFMFYHDHAFGITRLNVYAGEAAGYVITDPTEQQLVADGIIPGLNPDDQIPLIIQDKSFVDAATIVDTDPTWRWGTGLDANDDGYPDPKTGDLWMPHVYIPAQNPADEGGTNPYGRWHYGPWFWPPTTNIAVGPQPNPYYDSANPENTPLQGPEIPGTPDPSMGMESFFDTPIVNGTAYPTLDVDPKAYRFRILNAANDRFWNLQLYVADPAASTPFAGLTEVKMVPAGPTAGFPADWPADGRAGGVPDPATAGPDFIQIGNEGGFLPAPTVLPMQPITWNLDPTTFNFGNADLHTLLLGPAERADVIVDFRDFAGQTLILYNDAPAAFPALDARYDFYTGSPDLTDTGGYWGTPVGYGPNTRTIMQIKVADAAPAAPFDLAALEAEFASTPTAPGVFARSQDPIIVGQAEYNSAYNKTFSAIWPLWGIVRIQDSTFRFATLDNTTPTLPLEPKAIQDEMGEAFDTTYGRMSGMLGLEAPSGTAGVRNFMLYGYASPPVELLEEGVEGTLIGAVGDNTQIWKITHNGVDTHPIHFHLFDVQLINRVGWDGAIRRPDANELGWKETVRISPLEDTIVALRPKLPVVPFDVPNSVRPINPALPLGAELEGAPGGFFDPIGEPVNPVINHLVNFGWEYVVHCHILSHEEMDMMHGVAVAVKPRTPTGLTATLHGGPTVLLSWADASANETGFRIERANDPAFTVGLTTFTVGEGVTVYTDSTVAIATDYYYRVAAINTVGDTTDYSVVSPASIGFPTKTAVSPVSNTAVIGDLALEHDAAGVTFDRWVTGYSTAYSGGGYVYSRWVGTRLDAKFTGDSIRWVGPKQPGYGMADVYIDGALVASNVDGYAAAPGTLSAVIWQSATLADGPHTISIRLTGNKNVASTGYVVVLDRFEVTGAAPAGGGNRVDDSLATPGYTGTWIAAINPTYFNQTYRYSRWVGAAFTANFTGTRVAWIGPRTPNYGMAEVWIDGAMVATVDTYRANLAVQGWREVVWESGLLATGAHTIQIRPTGTMNPASSAANIVVDALDVMP